MENTYRAAKTLEVAHPLNLQLFNDDAPVEEPIETVAEIEPTEPVVETTEPTEPEVQGDITQTQAFSRRLKEETERARQEAIDTEYATLYADYGITSKADYERAMAEREEQAIREKYGEEESQDIIDAMNFRKENQPLIEKQREQDRMFSEWAELTAEHGDIKDFSQIPPEAWQLSANKGIPLLDAYNRTLIKNQKTLIEKTRLETEQETIRKINNNAVTSAGSASGGIAPQRKPVSEMTEQEFALYRDEVKNRKRE